MAFRLTNIGGFEVTLSMDDRARANPLWQYFLKPVAKSVRSLKATVTGAVEDASGHRADVSPAARPAVLKPEQAAVYDRIKDIDWYHTIDLGNGVLTPGRFNHLPLLKDYGLPESLSGKRCLDVATMNGFWAFQMEKLGAAEVVALDVEKLGDLDIPPLERQRMPASTFDVPRGTGFFAAKEILGSKVDRRNLNVYDLSPETTGKFDFVFMGDLLLHLINPIKAAANVCSVTSGVAHIVECYSPYLQKNSMMYLGAEQGTWWGLSLSAVQRILHDAGFRKVTMIHKFKAPSQPGQAAWMWRAVFRCEN